MPDVTKSAGAMRARAMLVIEDELPIRRAVKNALQDVADRIIEAATGRAGIDLAAAERPALVILDLGLPDIPGVEVCREIRRWAAMPILVLSARHAEEEKVQLLTVGADDYVTKPFSIPEFAARVRALLRRARTPNPMTHAVLQTSDGLTIDFARRTLVRDGETIRLTPLDNSFLIEEAYNQEAGVVQHISSWQRSLRSSAWAFTFTQEWPLGGGTHQLRYTIPVQRTESPPDTGVREILLNYLHQLRPASARVAIAPRF